MQKERHKRYNAMTTNPKREKMPRGYGMSEGRRAWTSVSGIEIIEYDKPGIFKAGISESYTGMRDKYAELVGTDEDEIQLTLKTNKANVYVNLSSLTEAELNAIQKVINIAIDKALPIVRARDQIVKEMYDEYGDDSQLRLYRDVPKVFTRKRKVT